MAMLIYTLDGVRGRKLKVYDTKIILTTKKTIGSLLTHNFTDGEKTIYLCDVVGVQYKKSGKLIGYLQFETPSMQMNNKSSNMFSENTFTFADGKNGVSNKLMGEVYSYVVNRIEELKYGTTVTNTPKDDLLHISDIEDAASKHLKHRTPIGNISCTLIYVIPKRTGQAKEMHLDMSVGDREFTSLDLFYDVQKEAYYFNGRHLALDDAWHTPEDIFDFDVALFKRFNTKVDEDD